ncbi:MAG: TonB-dependent receptor [Betaproteobacteria bacterium]|nr:TonB-dependent receptor [Betaproteobacteria bacterium]
MIKSDADATFRFPLRLCVAAVASVLTGQALAVDTVRTAPVVVTATRVEESSFDLPTAIDSIANKILTEATLQANVSESLPRVPGTYVQSREAYSQEQQISIRGFGARSSFGTRGVRLYIDGVPASTPDGQGGTGNFDFSSAKSIEVLRGAFSALYGNHSGGVVQIFTEDGPKDPTLTGTLAIGSYNTQRYGLKFGGTYGAANAIGSFSYLTTDGYRDHSSASRYLFNGKFGSKLGDSASLTVVANYLDEPEDQDPLTLDAQQVAANPRQARPEAYQYNTRRSLENKQVGVVYENQWNAVDTIRVMTYGGQRNNTGYLAFSGSFGLSSGGVTQLARDYGGLGLRWTRKTTLFGDQPFTITSGADYDLAMEARKGYINNNGTIGALRRNEDNRTHSWGLYSQVEWEPISTLSAFAGLRYTQVAFKSQDYFITGTNPNDSGSLRFDAWTPVIGALVHVTPVLNVYANAGRSFETPTFIELAYRDSSLGSGPNFALKPATSNQYELGAKAFVSDNTRLNLAFFQIYTNNEIVVASSSGGRTVYTNAPGSQRTGLEASVDSDLGGGLNVYGAYTFLRAVFDGSFPKSGGGVVPDGSQIPGVPRSYLYVDVSWHDALTGYFAGLEERVSSKIYADDQNTAFADHYQVTSVRTGIEREIGNFTVQGYVRVNNLFNKKYIAGVAVNDSNGYYYAPAAERNYLVGASAAMKF